MRQSYTEIMQPDTTVEFDMVKYDQFGLQPVLDPKTGESIIIEVVLNKPTLDNDEELAEIIKDRKSNKDYFREAVRLLIPKVKGKKPPALSVDKLIMETGGYQRQDSLPQRALALFGRNDPERMKILQEVLAGQMKDPEAIKKAAENASIEKVEGEAAEEMGLTADDIPTSSADS